MTVGICNLYAAKSGGNWWFRGVKLSARQVQVGYAGGVGVLKMNLVRVGSAELFTSRATSVPVVLGDARRSETAPITLTTDI